ncbi:uncharacterized protein LOC129976066 isoform X2 [Argiope bruennichi]|uniref:uncharacterized protein LOC129976066 isoform X2 n=1 Tax=Argiope bruennichi TaxID=94029 RepID=UPI0024952EDD|nr:uncharacterized protein LOC129976066 isoform X2 [Argiope bruennichi]
MQEWYDDPQKSTQSEMFLNDKNFSLETSRDPGCSAGVSGISVPHKEPSMASSSAQADVLSTSLVIETKANGAFWTMK